MRETLKAQLQQAQLEYEATLRSFDRIIKELPSGIPQPDGSLRIHKAGQASTSALQNYRSALKRFSEFTLHGRLPADLPPDQ